MLNGSVKVPLPIPVRKFRVPVAVTVPVAVVPIAKLTAPVAALVMLSEHVCGANVTLFWQLTEPLPLMKKVVPWDVALAGSRPSQTPW